MIKKLEDKVIIITGGCNGVGRAAAETFAKEGAKVVIGDIDEKPSQTIIRTIKTIGGEAIFIKTQLKNVEDIKNLFEKAFDKYGRIDGLFCYAGITPVSPLDICEENLFDEIISINFKASFFCCQEAIKYMRMNNGGSIVLTGSAHAWGGEKDRAAYACSKGTLLTLMQHISQNYANEHIRCNYLTLGWTPTEGEVKLRKELGESESELRKRASKVLPMGRMCERTDYLDGLVYLMSDGSSMMTGSTLRITAGEYIGNFK